MPIHLTWYEAATRLILALLAGALIGWNRTTHGRAAGLRTTALVSLAACIAMIQVNILLPVAGKPQTSFVVMDLMRLPLGILSGMGFIGAGAIVRRDNFVVGVTTAAAMWFVTVTGLCFGGGQIALGIVGTAIGFAVLAGLSVVESRMDQDHLGRLTILTVPSGPTENEIRSHLISGGVTVAAVGFTASHIEGNLEFSCDVRWRTDSRNLNVPPIVHSLAERSGVVRIAWTPQSR